MTTDRGREPRPGPETPNRFDLARWAYEKIEAVDGPAQDGRAVLARLSACLATIDAAGARRPDPAEADKADEPGAVAGNEAMPWTKDEEQTIIARHQGGMPVRDIARMAGRSTAAIRNRLRRLGAT